MDKTRRCLVCQRILDVDKFPRGSKFTCRECRERAKKSYKLEHGGTVKGGRMGVWKTCKKCGIEKPIIEFLPGFDHCRACQRARRNA